MRALWQRLRERIALIDELKMATLRFRLKYEWEEVPEGVNHIIWPHEVDQLYQKQVCLLILHLYHRCLNVQILQISAACDQWLLASKSFILSRLLHCGDRSIDAFTVGNFLSVITQIVPGFLSITLFCCLLHS